MSRPKPKVLFEIVDRNYKAEQVLEADAVYAVCYDDQPINLRTLNVMIDYPGPKYKKTVFVNSGHAFNLAERLNKVFKTDQFKVYKMVLGEIATEED